MPRAKRSKAITLSKTEKKDKSLNLKVLQKIEKNVPLFSNIYLLKLDNLNSEAQALLRKSINGEFIFGRKKILSKFFELHSSENKNFKKFAEGIDSIKSASSQFCLLLSNESPTDIEKKLSEVDVYVFAQPGTIASANIILQRGSEVFKNISTSNAAYLRTLGLFVVAKQGLLDLEEDFRAASKNQPLKVAQCKVLKMLGVKSGKFHGSLAAYLLKPEEQLKVFN